MKENERSGLGRPPPGYLAKGYFQEKDKLFPELLDRWARDIADGLANGGMATSQLRRFFDETKRIKRKLENTRKFNEIVPEILKLSAYANDAVKKRKAPTLFNDFINQNLKWASLGEKEFLIGFVNHFECVVGFFPKTRG